MFTNNASGFKTIGKKQNIQNKINKHLQPIASMADFLCYSKVTLILYWLYSKEYTKRDSFQLGKILCPLDSKLCKPKPTCDQDPVKKPFTSFGKLKIN